MGPAWTASSPLPGGDLGEGGLEGFIKGLVPPSSRLRAGVSCGLARRYGTLVDDVLGEAEVWRISARTLGGGLTEREVLYQRDHEWARAPDDVLWRRTKCGLHMSAEQRAAAAESIAGLLYQRSAWGSASRG